MKYFLRIEDRTYEVVMPEAGECTQLTIDGESVDIDAINLNASGEAELVVDNRSFVAHVSSDHGAYRVTIDGFDCDVTATDERTEAIRKLTGNHNGKRRAVGEIRAPMPGLVVNIGVAVGDPVSKGQGIIIVEAMKMENEITAPIDGVVESISVEAGKAVNKGEIMLVVKA